jgi:hypothetical protein
MGLGRLLHRPKGFGFYLLSGENMRMMLHGDGKTCRDQNTQLSTVTAQQPKDSAAKPPPRETETLCEAVMRQGDCNTGSVVHQDWVALNCAKSCSFCTPIAPLRERMTPKVLVNYMGFVPAYRDCVVGVWSKWSKCPECGSDQTNIDIKHRTRRILARAGQGGRSCPVLRSQGKCAECPGGSG